MTDPTDRTDLVIRVAALRDEVADIWEGSRSCSPASRTSCGRSASSGGELQHQRVEARPGKGAVDWVEEVGTSLERLIDGEDP